MSGVLPAGWASVRLGDFGTWRGGGTPSKANAEFWSNGSIPWISPKDMGPEVLTGTQDAISVSAVAGSSVRLVPAGSVAVVVRSGILERKLPVAWVPFEATLNQDMKALTPNVGIEPKWVSWGLRAYEREILDRCRKTGTTVASIDSRKLMDFEFPVPPLEEQRRIVAILDDHLSRVDAAERFVDHADRRFRGLVKSLMMQLVPDAPRPGWRMVTVAEAGTIQLGRQRHPDWHTGPEMRPYLRVANIFENRIDTTDVMEMDFTGIFDRYRLEPGDVLLCEGQSPEFLGRPAIYRGEPREVAFTNSLIRFKANADVMPEWALLVFRRHMHLGRFMKESRITTNIAHLSARRLKDVEFPIPPLSEQARLVATADEQFGSIEVLRDQLKAQRLRAAALRRSLLEAAFSGRLTSGRAVSTAAAPAPSTTPTTEDANP